MCCLVLTLICLFHVCIAKTNILFLMADDMRPDLGCYTRGNFSDFTHPYIHSPNLDSLARRSLLLKRAYVQVALCSPSRTSLLTGRRPDTTHVYDLDHFFRRVGGNFTTIPQHFKNNGYISVGIGKVFHPGENASGFDDPTSWTLPFIREEEIWETVENSWAALKDKKLLKQPLVDFKIADRAVSTLRQLAHVDETKDTPFFLAVGFYRPHLPFVFPDSLLKLYPTSDIRLPENGYAPTNMPDIASEKYHELLDYEDIKVLGLNDFLNTSLPKDLILKLRRAYYSSITWTDMMIGRVLDELEELGLANNTIISFLGDHGWHLGEHGIWGKETNFELATRAPMMIHIPRLTESGIVSNELAEFVDLFPTLVEAADLSPLPLCPEDSSDVKLCREGSSLMPLITNQNAPWKNASFSQCYRNGNVMGYSIKTDRFRYTEWAKFTSAPVYKPDWNQLYGVELYDHKNDPEENSNVVAERVYQNIKQKLSNQLHDGWRKSLPLQ